MEHNLCLQINMLFSSILTTPLLVMFLDYSWQILRDDNKVLIIGSYYDGTNVSKY